jgi:hypothetical protein
MVPSFIPGLKLSQIFFEKTIKPLLDEYHPELKYDAALIGPGSEVLGFDDPVSTDHHWGPRVQLFLKEMDFLNHAKELDILFKQKLPYTIKGYSTHWSEPDPNDAMNQFLEPKSEGLVNHRVEILTVSSFLKACLNLETTELIDLDWLLLPEQKLLELTAGKVYYSTLGDLIRVRNYFSYYPDNVWFFKLAAEWDNIAEEIAFVGRSASRGDDLGSRLVSARLVRSIIRLAFILCRKYAPYSKWYAYSFSSLPIADNLHSVLLDILHQNNWRKREELLTTAYLILLEYQNSLEITPEITLKPINYHSRHQNVIDVHKIITELKKNIKPPLSTLPYSLGSIDQFIVNTHILTDAQLASRVKSLYE